jgi:hypothetical protein
MALVLLPGLTNLIEDISEEKKLPPQVVEAAFEGGTPQRGMSGIGARSIWEWVKTLSMRNISAISTLPST